MIKKTLLATATSAALLGPLAASAAGDMGQGTITFTGSVTEAPCSITGADTNLTINLGQISKKTLTTATSYSPSVPMEIHLNGCQFGAATGAPPGSAPEQSQRQISRADRHQRLDHQYRQRNQRQHPAAERRQQHAGQFHHGLHRFHHARWRGQHAVPVRPHDGQRGGRGRGYGHGQSHLHAGLQVNGCPLIAPFAPPEGGRERRASNTQPWPPRRHRRPSSRRSGNKKP